MCYFAFVAVPEGDRRLIRGTLGLRVEPVANRGILQAFPDGDAIAMVVAGQCSCELVERTAEGPVCARPSFARGLADLARLAGVVRVVLQSFHRAVDREGVLVTSETCFTAQEFIDRGAPIAEDTVVTITGGGPLFVSEASGPE
jgi:hypothetical protein